MFAYKKKSRHMAIEDLAYARSEWTRIIAYLMTIGAFE